MEMETTDYVAKRPDNKKTIPNSEFFGVTITISIFETCPEHLKDLETYKVLPATKKKNINLRGHCEIIAPFSCIIDVSKMVLSFLKIDKQSLL